MKKFISKTCLTALPVILLLISVNYLADPANLFSTEYEDEIVSAIMDGKNVTNIENYDERTLQRNLINKSRVCPEILVLGSSRTMLISSKHFKGKTFFNNSVSGASIEDIIAIYQMYEKKNCGPKKIILALDPWILNVNNGQNRWKSISPEFNSFLKSINKDTILHIDDKYLELISPSYFQTSFRMLLRGKNKPIITKSAINNDFTKLSDGSICYDAKYRNASTKEINNGVAKFINDGMYSIEQFDALSIKYRVYLKKLIEKMKSRHSEIVFFLSPYHPKVYESIEKNIKYRHVIAAENYFRKLAKEEGISIIGSYNPDYLHLDQGFFYDGMHCKEEGIEFILLSN